MTELSENGTLDPGEIRFVDNYLPPLGAGDYSIRVKQTLKGDGAYQVNSWFEETQEFTVSGPRFNLDPSDVYAMFPPPNSQGTFERDLPHIMLTKRALPWERSINSDQTIPWMALLLFDPSEILPPIVGTNAKSDAFNPTGVTTVLVQELVESKPDEPATFQAYSKKSIDDGEMAQSCQVIDITLETLKAVMPSLDDARNLAHCRVVNLADKAPGGLPSPGIEAITGSGEKWFSVVVGGRFPSPPAHDQAGGLNVVHLVSLEGFESYLDDTGNANFSSHIERVRLVSLASWSFTCLPESGESFGELMKRVAGNGNAALDFKLHTQKPVLSATKEEKLAFQTLEAGYIPCSYQTRQGEQTFAWYRGPFTPQLAPRFPPDREPFLSSTHAMIYDQVHGLFDLSYAVAWETGRLLALSDQRFGVAMLNWRRKAYREIDRPQDQDSATDALSDFFDHCANAIEPENSKLSAKTPADPDTNLTAAASAPTSQAELDQDEAAKQRLKQAGEVELKLICEWLAHLYLLYGVPFNNLVPDERLLPPESVRFFYLDRNWLEVMLDGALGIGVQSSRDIWHWNALRGFIGDAVQPGKAGHGPLAGLLLRSAVVSGWPGLEVRAYSNSDGKAGSGQVGLLRMDRPSADVLMCLFDQVPAWIEFNEPMEGLHFGVEGNKGEEFINLRYLSGKGVGKPAHVTAELVPDPHRKLNIQALRNEIKTNLRLGGGDELGPAAFALQMVKAPEQMVFQAARVEEK